MVVEGDWQEFGPAFAEAVRPDDTRGRPVKRLLVIGLAAMLAAALNAVVYGAVTASRGGAAHAKAATMTVSPSATAGPAGSTWTAVAGPTCSNSATRFVKDGYYVRTSNGQSTGWITSSSGGYSGGGCTGGFVSVPLSGHAEAYDTDQFALWTFHLGAGFTHATCTLSTFVPYNPQIAYVGGDPAYFFYYGTNYSPGSTAQPLGGYLVHQPATRGDWVASGSFAIKTGWVAVKMVDAGVTGTRATSNAHAAAAQLRLACHAAS
jgi:hypothetical protein